MANPELPATMESRATDSRSGRIDAERAALLLSPRTTGNCLDAAARVYGRQMPLMLRLWLLVAVPACGLVYALNYWHEMDVRLSFAVVYVGTLVQGLLLIAAVLSGLAGRPAGIRHGAALVGGAWLGLMARTGLMRCWLAVGPALMMFSKEPGLVLLGLAVLIVPGALVALRFAFLAEQAVLSAIDPGLHDRHTTRLVRKEVSDLYGRACSILVCFVMLWVVLLVTVDNGWYVLLGSSPLLGRLEEAGGWALFFNVPWQLIGEIWHVLSSDPLLSAMLTGIGLLVYPIARLAWMFCYFDIRVRKDCWDIQLRMDGEVARLKGNS